MGKKNKKPPKRLFVINNILNQNITARSVPVRPVVREA